jgi:cathepsin L
VVKAAIATYGAVTTAVYARGWTGYGGDVMDAYPNGSSELVSSSGATINHAVTIVGWCDTKGAWIVKNSWGSDWGPYRGYCYVKYGHYNINARVHAALPNP